MKICAIFNIAPLYREPIYSLMSEKLDIDFLAGDQSMENIALMRIEKLPHFKGYLRNIYKGSKLIWQRKAVTKAFSKKYDAYILTGNTGMLSNWIILLLSKLLGRRTYLWTHGLYGCEQGLQLRKNLLYLKLADGLLFYNRRGAEIAINHGVAPQKAHILYNSLDYQKQLALLPQLGDRSFLRNYFGNDDPTVCFMGRLTPVKRIDLLLQACANLACNIIIVGEGPQRQALEDTVETLSMQDRVWFYGECYDEQMNATIITHCAAVVSPGNAGLNVIHALTYGTPMITHDNLCNQMPEIEAVLELQQRCNIKLLFTQNDVNDLQTTISNILSQTPDIKNKLRQAATNIIAEHWNPNSQIQTLFNIFGT